MKQNVSPVAIGVVAVVLVAILGFVGYKTFGPKPKPTYTNNAQYEAYQKDHKYPQGERPGGGGAPPGSPTGNGAPGGPGGPSGSTSP